MKTVKATSIRTTARIAGILYLLQIPLGVFGILYASKVLMGSGNMATTGFNILANEFTFRLSIVSAILCALVTIATAVYIFKVLRYVNESYAKWIILFAMIVAPISILNELNSIAVLLLLKNHEFAASFTQGQLQSLISLFLDLHKFGYQIAGIFFGLWLLPMGYLVIKSTFIPKIIGVLLIVTCLGYLTDFVTFFLYPGFGIVISEYTWIGEVLMVLWLLIKGVSIEKFEKWNQESLNMQPERTQYL